MEMCWNWYTRWSQKPLSYDMRVQVPPSLPQIYFERGIKNGKQDLLCIRPA